MLHMNQIPKEPASSQESVASVDVNYKQKALSFLSGVREVYIQSEDDVDRRNQLGSYFNDLQKVALDVGRGRPVQMEEASPFLLQALAAMGKGYEMDSDAVYVEHMEKNDVEETVRRAQVATELFAKVYEYTGGETEAPSSVEAILRKSEHMFRVAEKAVGGPAHQVFSLEAILQEQKDASEQKRILAAALPGIISDIQERSQEAYLSHAGDDMTDEEYSKVKEGLASAVEGVYMLLKSREAIDRKLAEEDRKSRSTQVTRAAQSHDVKDAEQISRVREQIYDPAGNAEAEARPAKSGGMTVAELQAAKARAAKMNVGAGTARAETNEQEEEKQALRALMLRCDEAISKLREEAVIRLKMPWSQAKKRHDALMTLSGEIGTATLPERRRFKTKAEMDEQIQAFEERLKELGA